MVAKEHAFNEANLFRAMEEQLAMIIFDANGNILWANDHFLNVVKYELSELETMHHRQLCTEGFARSAKYEQFWKNLRNNMALNRRVPRVAKGGEILWLDAVYAPVLNDEGVVDSVIKIASDVTKQQTILRDSSDEFVRLVGQMVENTNVVHELSQKAVNNMAKLESETNTVNDNVGQIEEMATAVKGIASQSQILGLNAGIEAARAGEHGKGFTVVADEVQKMAKNSKKAAEDIESQLDYIANSVKIMTGMVEEVTKNINNNSVSINELKNAYEEITKTAEELSELL